MEVVKGPKRRATTADGDFGILAQQKFRRTHFENKLTPTLEVGAERATCKSHKIYHSKSGESRQKGRSTEHRSDARETAESSPGSRGGATAFAQLGTTSPAT